MSGALPAGNVTISCTDRAASTCAQAVRDIAGSAATLAARCKNLRRGSSMALPPRHAARRWKRGQRRAHREPDLDRRLECSPADGTSAAAELRGVRHVPPAALRSGYIMFAHERSGKDWSWHEATKCPVSGGGRKSFARSELPGSDPDQSHDHLADGAGLKSACIVRVARDPSHEL